MSHTGGQQSLPVLLHLELSQPGGDSDASAAGTASRSSEESMATVKGRCTDSLVTVTVDVSLLQ